MAGLCQYTPLIFLRRVISQTCIKLFNLKNIFVILISSQELPLTVMIANRLGYFSKSLGFTKFYLPIRFYRELNSGLRCDRAGFWPLNYRTKRTNSLLTLSPWRNYKRNGLIPIIGFEPISSCFVDKHFIQLNYIGKYLPLQDLNLRPTGYFTTLLSYCSPDFVFTIEYP